MHRFELIDEERSTSLGRLVGEWINRYVTGPVPPDLFAGLDSGEIVMVAQALAVTEMTHNRQPHIGYSCRLLAIGIADELDRRSGRGDGV